MNWAKISNTIIKISISDIWVSYINCLLDWSSLNKIIQNNDGWSLK